MSRITRVTLADLKRNPPTPMPSIWGPADSPWVVRPSVNLIGGEQKVGKSLFAKQLLYALIDPSVTTFLGAPIATLKCALYLNEEVPQPGVTTRMQKITGAPLRECDENFVVPPERGLRFDTEPLAFLEVCKEAGAEAVGLDPLDRFHRWDLDKNLNAGMLMNHFHSAVRELGLILFIIHHFNKEQQGEMRSSFTRFRGSGRLTGDSDSNFTLVKRPGGFVELDAQLRHGEWEEPIKMIRTPSLRFQRVEPDRERSKTTAPTAELVEVPDEEVARQTAGDGSDVGTVWQRLIQLGMESNQALELAEGAVKERDGHAEHE